MNMHLGGYMKYQKHTYKSIYQIYLLRAHGYSYGRISKVTLVPKSTVRDMIKGLKSYAKFKKLFMKDTSC